MTTCRDCGSIGAAFYASMRQPCKECVKARARRYRSENLEKVQAYDRLRGGLPHRRAERATRAKLLTPEKKREYAQRHWAKYADRRKVRGITDRAIASGQLVPKPCERCGFALGVQAHHEDYSKPLDVVWLCTKCHGARHREINAERRAARKAA